MTRETRNIVLHSAPFLVWIGLQTILPTSAGAYALRAAATAAAGIAALALAGWRPSLPKARAVLTGAVGGLAVCAIWVLPEYSDFYRTWFTYPVGSLPPPPEASPYEPAVCGWTLTVAKLVGSAFVIAPVEEVFFRSFLYRWLQRRDFASVPSRAFDLSAFLWMVALFTLEHDRPVVAAIAGAAYGLLYVRFGLASAICAHVVTNLALALHVVVRGEWAFW